MKNIVKKNYLPKIILLFVLVRLDPYKSDLFNLIN